MVTEFRARRDLVVAGLNAIPGIRCATPLGAFYVFPDVSGTGLSGAELAERLLTEAGVCGLAGIGFGLHGRDHIRLSYANSRANLTEALGRIRGFVDGLAGAEREPYRRSRQVRRSAATTRSRIRPSRR